MAFHRNAAQTNASNEAARITSIVAGQNLTCAPSRQDPGAVAWCVQTDRESTRLNSSHSQISAALFCLKKKRRVEHVLIHISMWLRHSVLNSRKRLWRQVPVECACPEPFRFQNSRRRAGRHVGRLADHH